MRQKMIFFALVASATLAGAFIPAHPMVLTPAGRLVPVRNVHRAAGSALPSPAAALTSKAHDLSRTHVKRAALQFGPRMSASSSSSAIVVVKQGAQIGMGAAAIFALERALWALARELGIRIPTAPAGMLLLFAAMMVIHAVSPKTADGLKDWFKPSLTFYSKGVPLFFSPPLVQLPLSLGILPLLSIVKYLIIIATGTVFSVIATGLAANALVATPPVEDKPSAEETSSSAEGGGRIGTTTISISTITPQTSPVLKVAIAGMAVFGGTIACLYSIACLVSNKTRS